LTALAIRFAKLSDRDHFAPAMWPQHAFGPNPAFPGWWQFDLDALALADSVYEYEFLANGNVVVADPYADAITRFGGYRKRKAESGTGPILLNWAARPTSERSSPGRGILISAHLSRATRGTRGRL